MTLSDYDPVERWAADPKRVAKAETFLVDAHGHGARGADELQAHALATNESRIDPWDYETVHLAVHIEWDRERACTAEVLCPVAQELFDLYERSKGGDGWKADRTVKHHQRAFTEHRLAHIPRAL